VGIIAGLLPDKLGSRRIELLRHPYQVEGLYRCGTPGKGQDARSRSKYASGDCRSQHCNHCAPDNIFLNNLAKRKHAKRKPCWTPFQTNRNDMVSHYPKSHDKAQGDEFHQLSFPQLQAHPPTKSVPYARLSHCPATTHLRREYLYHVDVNFVSTHTHRTGSIRGPYVTDDACESTLHQTISALSQ
jgi:hypothetical protein